MRYLIASLMLCFSATSYAQDVAAETPVEVTTADEGDSSEEVAAVDSRNVVKHEGGCGCKGKPK